VNTRGDSPVHATVSTVQATIAATTALACLCLYWHQQVWDQTITGGQLRLY